MILHKLILNNVGLFRGRQVMNLTPIGKKNIILIGGINGAGKTTLLEAVRLCLYGRRALGTRVSLHEYHEHLSNIIHRNPILNSPLNQASVALEFEYTRDGEKKEYRVERSWKRQRSAGAIKESLTIYENSNLNAEFETEFWQDYINELIPIGVSQFFFFDSEDIRKLVDDSNHDVFLQESVKSLLGLNLVERLQSDLSIYANRLIQRGNPEPVQMELDAVETEIAALTSSLADAKEQIESLRTQIEKLEIQIARQESRIAAEGGGYAKQRESLQVQRKGLQAEIEELEGDIRGRCEKLFPFALAPKLLKRLQERLLKEKKLDDWNAEQRVLNAQNKEMLENLEKVLTDFESGEFWKDTSIVTKQISKFRNQVTSTLKKTAELPEELQNFTKITDRSASEHERLLNWIDISLNEVPQKFQELSDTLTDRKLQLERVNTALERVPSEDVLKPLIEKLSELGQTLGGLQQQLQSKDEYTQSITQQLTQAERKQIQLKDIQQLGFQHQQRQQRVDDVQSVLSTYASQLTHAKITTLGRTIAECFNQLSHKPDRIKRVKLDSQTFAVTLYDTHNCPLSTEELSAGEKQIYTTSLLWGLAKTSGRALPMILDTPLGRLDSNHRQLLVEHYFPYVSHQVVLLSTDTEIVGDLLSLLIPHVSHTFRLAYQQTEGYTKLEEGYFR